MPFNKPITGAQLFEALKSMTPDELALPIHFFNRPIHPRITLVINKLDESEPHISFLGSLRTMTDEVPVKRTDVDG